MYYLMTFSLSALSLTGPLAKISNICFTAKFILFLSEMLGHVSSFFWL